MPKFSNDDMQDSLLTEFATDYVADGLAQWTAKHGPDWELISDYITAETGLPIADGWSVYWDDNSRAVRLRFEDNTRYITENDRKIRID